MENKAVWLLAGLCLLALPAEPAAAQPDTWQVHVDAGQKAFNELRYQEAEGHYLAALEEAEKLGGEDARHADSLNRLALLYRAQDRYDEAEPFWRRCCFSIRCPFWRRCWDRRRPMWVCPSTIWH